MAKNKESGKVRPWTTPEEVIARLNRLRSARERLSFSSTIKQISTDETKSEHTKNSDSDVDNSTFRHKMRTGS